MEIRVLRYFLAVAREETISGAAEALHVTQPTLSRQLMDLEKELGKKLLIRGNRKITLTEEGVFFRKRAQEIIELVDKTANDFHADDDFISGSVHIGGGETDAMRLIAGAVKKWRGNTLIFSTIFSVETEMRLKKNWTWGFWISACSLSPRISKSMII